MVLLCWIHLLTFFFFHFHYVLSIGVVFGTKVGFVHPSGNKQTMRDWNVTRGINECRASVCGQRAVFAESPTDGLDRTRHAGYSREHRSVNKYDVNANWVSMWHIPRIFWARGRAIAPQIATRIQAFTQLNPLDFPTAADVPLIQRLVLDRDRHTSLWVVFGDSFVTSFFYSTLLEDFLSITIYWDEHRP